MKTTRRAEGARTAFVILEPDPAYHQAIRDLAYQPVADGFARAFPSDAPHLDRAYATFARHAEAMVRQAARLEPTPWDEALLTFLRVVDGKEVDWWLGGSAALAVRGLDVAPRDLDLVDGRDGTGRLADLLRDHLVEPVTRGWISDAFGRAFLHARIEWIGGIDAGADEPLVGDVGPTAASRLETVAWRGRELRVPPLDVQLAVNERRGLTTRVEQIKRLLRG